MLELLEIKLSNPIENEFPFKKLLDLMTKTDGFEKLFEKIFPIDNYKT